MLGADEGDCCLENKRRIEVTRPARDGRDGPFSDWLRRHPELEANLHWLYAMDVDMVFHKFKTWVDCEGTRDVKLMMDVEVKTFGRQPDDRQLETLYFRHQILASKKWRYSTLIKKSVRFWHFGVYVLILDGGARPDCCNAIQWRRFEDAGKLTSEEITLDTLKELLRLDVRPDTLQPVDLRRHHKTKELMEIDWDGLFPVPRKVVKRS